jgi:hypothetical protein
MSLKLPQGRPLLAVLVISIAALFLVSGILVNMASAGSGPTITAACPPPADPTAGCFGVVINQQIFSTLRFTPNKPIYVHRGEWITIKDTSNDVHTFSIVASSVLPKTVADVGSCGAPPPAPASICSVILAAHLPAGPPTGPPPPPQNSCIKVTSPTPVNQCIDEGHPVANNGAFPGLDTAFTLTKGGDSIILLPNQSFTVQITAKAGTVLHFMCAIHPWMQGELIVTA